MGEVDQVGALRLVELQRPGNGVEHFLGDALEVATFELGVVLDTDSGQVGDLTASQTGHAPFAAIGR
jgi:hypothetical protein